MNYDTVVCKTQDAIKGFVNPLSRIRILFLQLEVADDKVQVAFINYRLDTNNQLQVIDD